MAKTQPAERAAVERELVIMSGNEALARGAWEAGVRFASAYPGTPSTEILEALVRYEDVYCEWAPNEKVAIEAATGASLAGARALATMKHVGLNVGADPFFSASHIGVKGGFVIVSADDPAMHSSQDEQDNRNYAKFAKMPMIEPSEADEAREYVKAAYELSEQFDAPVLVRMTTRTSHSQGVVELGERTAHAEPLTVLDRDPSKNLMMPHNARPRHSFVEQRLLDIADWAETTSLNRVEMGDPRIGIVTSGAAYGSAREAFPGASFLKLGLTYPLPRKLIADFRAKVDKLYVVEELDPFLEGSSACRASRWTAARTCCRSSASSTPVSWPARLRRPASRASRPSCCRSWSRRPRACPTARRLCAPGAPTAASSWRCARCAPTSPATSAATASARWRRSRRCIAAPAWAPASAWRTAWRRSSTRRPTARTGRSR